MQKDYSVGTLAFVGDAVITLYVRARLASSNQKSGQLTMLAGRLVSARVQAEIAQTIIAELDDSERDVLRRCKNAHTSLKAKNATTAEYHRATGLEGLIGWLYLENSNPLRLDSLLQRIFDIGMSVINEQSR